MPTYRFLVSVELADGGITPYSADAQAISQTIAEEITADLESVMPVANVAVVAIRDAFELIHTYHADLAPLSPDARYQS